MTLQAQLVWQLSMPLLLVSVIQDSLAAFKDGGIKASCGEIAAALTADYRPELVFILQQELQLYEFYQAQIAATDAEIEQCDRVVCR